MSKFVRAGFLIFGLVFVSRDFELRANISCEELTVSPCMPYGANFFYVSFSFFSTVLSDWLGRASVK